jgi:outer membrane protein
MRKIEKNQPCSSDVTNPPLPEPHKFAILVRGNTVLFSLAIGCTLLDPAFAQQLSHTNPAGAAVVDSPAVPPLPRQSEGNRSPAPNMALDLSLQQAVAMALKNNLDIEIEKVDQSVADVSISMAEGGGLPRAINYTVMDTPPGEASVAVPLLSFSFPGVSALNVDPISSTVSASYNTSRVLESSHSLLLNPQTFSNGSPVPGFDPLLLGRYGWLRRNPSPANLTSSPATPADTTTTDNTIGDTILTKGFSPGTTIQLGVNNFVESFYSGRSSAVPFSHPNAFAMIAQPLLRGAGHANNTRYIAIAKTNKKISAAVLEQQMISTITGVSSLYIDLVSLQDAVKVQEQALATAQLLLQHDQEQLNVGRLPPIEVARAESLVTSTQLTLTQAIAMRDQQQVILRTLLDPESLTNNAGDVADIVATDPLLLPHHDSELPLPQLVKRAWMARPDLRQARLQISNGERQVASTANAAEPELDVYGTYETRGIVIPGLTGIGGDLTGNAVLNPVPTGGTHSSIVYEAGLQFYLPIQNRVAKANLGADQSLLQQERLRVTQLEAEVAAEVRNAITALNAASSAAEAAGKARELQARLLDAAQESFQAGYGTNFAVIEQETYLAQAQTTEIMTKAAWFKAVCQLDRVVGRTLEKNGISIQDELNPRRP